MKRKVIVAGHICLDITPVFLNKKISEVSELLQPGKLIQMSTADVHTGGAVANTGLGMKILGADVSLMGKIGNDVFGDMICRLLQEYDAVNNVIRSEEESSSYSVVLAMPGIDRIFLHNPGANNQFYADDISIEALNSADLFHFGYPPLMRSIYENDGKELLSIFQKAKTAECITSLDMAAVDADSEAAKVNWDSILQKVIPYVDIFVPSVEELCFMLDKTRFKIWQERAKGKDITDVIDIEQDVKPLAQLCMDYGATVLIIKCGAAGMYYCTARCSKMQKMVDKLSLDMNAWENKEGFEKSYVPDKVLSGTGAGDTSIAAFLMALTEGETLEECMRLATAEGASCVASYDALSGLKSLAELRQKIAAGWRKK